MDLWQILGFIACFVVVLFAKAGLVLAKKGKSRQLLRLTRVLALSGIAESRLPPLTCLKCDVVRQYVTCRIWLLGALLDLFAGALSLSRFHSLRACTISTRHFFSV